MSTTCVCMGAQPNEAQSIIYFLVAVSLGQSMHLCIHTPLRACTRSHEPSVYNDRSLSYCVVQQSLEWSLDEGEKLVLSVWIWSKFSCFCFGRNGLGAQSWGGHIILTKYVKETTYLCHYRVSRLHAFFSSNVSKRLRWVAIKDPKTTSPHATSKLNKRYF